MYQIKLEYEHFTNFLNGDIYFDFDDIEKLRLRHLFLPKSLEKNIFMIVIHVATQKFLAFAKGLFF